MWIKENLWKVTDQDRGKTDKVRKIRESIGDKRH